MIVGVRGKGLGSSSRGIRGVGIKGLGGGT